MQRVVTEMPESKGRIVLDLINEPDGHKMIWYQPSHSAPGPLPTPRPPLECDMLYSSRLCHSTNHAEMTSRQPQ